MKVNKKYTLVNDAASEALGKSAITAKDTGSFVSLGNVVFSSTANTEQFYKSLVDRIGKTVIAIRKFKGKKRSVKRDDLAWGIMYQKISFKTKTAVENASWNTEGGQVNPFDINRSTEVVQKLFSVMGTWSYEDNFPLYQLFTAFTNEAAMGAFISGISTNIENSLTIAEDALANLAVSTNIAGVLISGKTVQKRNLLKEYNTLNGSDLKASNCLYDASFLKYASYQINDTVKNIMNASDAFNPEGIARQTFGEDLVVEVLGKYSAATASYLESDTYHKELVALPRYEEVSYWQAPGTNFDFADVSKIDIVNANLKTVGNETGTIAQSGIIAFIHDIDSCASIITRFRDYSYPNNRDESMNIIKKADKGYMVDLSENAVVFYVADAA